MAGLVALGIAPLSDTAFYVGSVSFICVLVVLNIFLVTVGVMHEKKDKVLLFVLSLPISTSGSTSPAFANLVFLPMIWLAGLFFPVPKAMEPWVVIWPAFHLNQVALAAAGVDEFKFIDPLMAAAVLAGVTVLFGGLAIRRLARVG